MMRKPVDFFYKIVRIGLIFLFFILLNSCNKDRYVYNQGTVYGTFYHIVYSSPEGKDFQIEIDKQLKKYNAIFSTYDPNSTISKINKNITTSLEPEFIACFNRSIEISKITDGAFDITAGNLVSAWGFGPKEREKMTSTVIDSLLNITGFQKIRLEKDEIVKDHQNITLDMSAIAKGYTCDLIAKFLQDKGCENYMIEIGGEVVTKGKNKKGKIWTIGINKPEDSSLFNTIDLEAEVELPNHALATSGNYRNYYVEDGIKYAHTIDPKSGHPVQREILSATVLSDNCMTADAFATAFMVMGLQKSIAIAEKQPEIEVFFIYTDKSDTLKHYVSKGFKQYLKK